MLQISAIAQKPDPRAVAEILHRHLAEAYRSDDVNLTIFGATVTIARGKRAAQISVVSDRDFAVAIKRETTFVALGQHFGRGDLVAMIRRMVGAPGQGSA